ncbi:putative RNA 2'-phosphotransferase [Actinoplanes octamycinicus]|uniref:Probable RNA 2'-phosphotransferase n=1 Tax=Actinoplanes octamycinicus TaxID=135948 RepID=A0A7W7GU10_9ACTN|nr:RNA 2'-phosphotransferase [Actinoplanes octamycinicus]MBB4738263.1 putative RNA 2'-phosphotransferase [Actinoplanes octamycinicus]GIE59176.1 putative RNA 2'-phosphotransferase [Actinoplanes octamycinicus]
MTELSRDQVRLSRRMSLVLRHRPEAAGLTLDANGWVPIADLLAALRISRAELDHVVAFNDKSRFAVATGADGVDRIRASQGHSRRVAVDLDLPPAEPPAVLYHGTPRDNLAAIRRDGLRPRSRHHVHLSADVPTALTIGRRRSADVVVFAVAAGVMAAEGHVFHRSANGVWLTAVVPPQHLSVKRTNP